MGGDMTPFFFEWTHNKCLRNVPVDLKVRLQFSNVQGRTSPKWMALMCLLTYPLDEKSFWHSEHWNLFSAVFVILGLILWESIMNVSLKFVYNIH